MGLHMNGFEWFIFWLVYLDFCSSLWQCFCRLGLFGLVCFFAMIKVDHGVIYAQNAVMWRW